MNKYRVAISGLIVSLFLGTPITYLAAKTKSMRQYHIVPKMLNDEIATRGSHTVVSELYSHPDKWNFVLSQIATGETDWLKVAIALHSGSDAGSSEMLIHSVGEALEKSPENVFNIALKEFRLEAICNGPDIDDVRYSSYTLALAAIEKRKNKISNISKPELSNVSRKCIHFLENSKSKLKKYFNRENPDKQRQP